MCRLGIRKGKIYRIVCPDGKYYIGSTFCTLQERFRKHKVKAQTTPDRPIYKHIEKFGWDDITIEELEVIYCKEDDLPHLEEIYLSEVIDDDNCLNSALPIENKLRTDELRRRRVNRNKDEINTRRRELRLIKKQADE